MPKLIKNQAVIENAWQTLEKDAPINAVAPQSLVPLASFLENAESLATQKDLGVWIDSDETAEALQPYLGQLAVIAVNFPKFIDGRGYSIGRLLRDRYGFKGELRAIGDILHDQLFFLKRCGFDAFAIRDDKNADAAIQGLADFSNGYQSAVDEPSPLFRRR